jgi:hypothetical protein
MIAAHPELFPNFYSLPSLVPRAFLNHVRNLLMFGHAHVRWLMAALIRGTDFLGVVDRWLQFAQADDAPHSSFSAERYYGSRTFASRFVEFLERDIVPDLENREAFQGLIAYSLAFMTAEEKIARKGAVRNAERQRIASTDILEFSSEVSVFDLPFRIEPLIQALRARKPMPVPERQQSLILVQREKHSLRAWWQPPIAATILRGIDGTSPLADQARRFAEANSGHGYDPQLAYFAAMEEFTCRGWLRIATAASTTDSDLGERQSDTAQRGGHPARGYCAPRVPSGSKGSLGG